MKDDRAVSIVYVELDALLDTRLPTIGKIDSQAAVTCMRDPLYFERIIDDFSEICGISHRDFRAAYAARDEDTVRASVITEIPFILNELVLKLERETIDTPFISSVKVEVNTYPYTFDAQETDLIALAVMTRCGTETEVTCVHYPLEILTPSYVRGRYSGMILYNFHDWMKHHLAAFEKVKMPRVSVLAPALFHDAVMDDNEFLSEGIAKGITAFQLSEVASVELFALSLLPAVNFSMARIPGHYTPKAKPVVDLPDPSFILSEIK